MSEVARFDREPVEPTPRGSMTPKRRAEVLLAYDGRCGRCGKKITEPGWIADHIIPLDLEGADDLTNLWPLHPECDKPKTSADLVAIKKTARIRRDADPETRRKSPRPMRSRGFQKDPLR